MSWFAIYPPPSPVVEDCKYFYSENDATESISTVERKERIYDISSCSVIFIFKIILIFKMVFNGIQIMFLPIGTF